jgi:peptidoglycan/LPS O-acetylase OafA/YrhL
MTILELLNERKNNFTLMRLLAALAVLFGHSYVLSTGLKAGEDPISNYLLLTWGESLPSISVNLFFVTSGFLVCSSYMQRENWFSFAEARILRIFPALIFAVLFCVFVVGAFATTELPAKYFSSPSTWEFLKRNMILITGIQYDLPGVFVNNPYPMSVNGSLWTLPIELRMYFLVAVLGLMSILKDKKIFNLFFIIICLVYAQSSNNNFFLMHDLRSAHLALLFILGAFIYVNRDAIPLNFLTLVGLGILVFFTRNYSFTLFVKSIWFAYFVLLLALHPKLRLPSIDHFGDISYGLYIYAFPVQQTFAYLLPSLQPLNMFIYSLLLTALLAILSWFLIEKPSLRLKGKLILFKDARNDPS